MLKRYSDHIRRAAMGAVGLWLLYNFAVWGCCGRYAEVGIGLRLAGMLLWGVLPGVVLLLLAAPPVKADGSLKWQAPLSLARLVSLLTCLVALVCAGEAPLGAVTGCASDADILIWGAGLLYVVYLALGSILLGLFALLVQWVVQQLFLRQRA